MINRPALVDRVLSGTGEPAGQMVPDVQGGYNSALKPPALDLDLAKKLLAEAGWPNGFGLTLHTSNNRVPKNGEVAQAVGQMFFRGALRVNVEAMPCNIYVPQATAQKFSMFLFSYGSTASSLAEAVMGRPQGPCGAARSRGEHIRALCGAR